MYYCSQCDRKVDSFNGEMIIIKDEIWKSICDHEGDVLCASCIEGRLGRKIVLEDFKSSKSGEMIPVNKDYVLLNNLI